jgi:elongation factor P
MLKITELKPNVLIEVDGEPFLILSASHQKLGRGQAMTRAKLKSLETGAITERVFKGNETIKEASLDKTKASYLYQSNENFYFMDNQTFEQFTLSKSALGFSANFLKEGQIVEILSFKNKPINISLPIKIQLLVTETEPGIRGGRETPGTKRAVLETGFALQVPLFIKEGDKILVDTRDGRYIERVKIKCQSSNVK